MGPAECLSYLRRLKSSWREIRRVGGQHRRSAGLARRDDGFLQVLGPAGPTAALVQHQEGQQAAHDDGDTEICS